MRFPRFKFKKEWVHNDVFYIITWAVAVASVAVAVWCFAQWGALTADKMKYKVQADRNFDEAAFNQSCLDQITAEYKALVSGSTHTNFIKDLEIHQTQMKLAA